MKKLYKLFIVILTIALISGGLQGIVVAQIGTDNNPLPQETPKNETNEKNNTTKQPSLSVEDFQKTPITVNVDGSFEHYVEEIEPGKSKTFNYSYTLPETMFNRADIMFVFDRTGSMGDEIDSVKSNAIEIMNDIRDALPYAWFGVASFMDYDGYFSYPGYYEQYGSSGDLPWIPGIDPTEKLTDVSNTINNLYLGWGADYPEDYTRVLYELRFTNWRAESKKIVILFGDAPTHDLDFAGYNFGGDPGRDGIAKNEDDLDFETTVAQLKNEGVSVVAVDSGYSPESEATFKGMSVGYDDAPGTGGLYYQLTNIADLPEKVVELIEEETGSIDKLELTYTDEYNSWVETTPAYYENVSPNTTVSFEIKVTVPSDTEPGFYPFIGSLIGDGSSLNEFLYFEITVPGASGSLDLGFKPGHDGYSFNNFDKGSDYYSELSWDMFQTFFGTENVLHPNGDRIGVAQYFYDKVYKTVGAVGHCDGMSVTSMFNYMGLEPSNMGDYYLPHYNKLWDAKLSNPTVRHAIEFTQGMQTSLELIEHAGYSCTLLENSPSAYFRYLKSLFQNNQQATIGIIWKEGEIHHGHSLLPYRLEEDPEHNKNYIYVYDSNDPDQWWDITPNKIIIDESTDTWTYETISRTYTGNRNECHLIVTPIDFYTHEGVPVWESVFMDPETKYKTNISQTSYNKFSISGPIQLLFIDDLGNRFGWQNGIFYNEIRGAYYFPNITAVESLGETYLIPDTLNVNIEIIGTDTGIGNLEFLHNNLYWGLNNINLEDGLLAGLTITDDDTSIEIDSLVKNFQSNIIGNHLLMNEDISTQINSILIEEGSAIWIKLKQFSDTDPNLGDYIEITNLNSRDQALGLSLIHRGGDGYSGFSNPEAILKSNSTAVIPNPAWQDLEEISLESDLNGDGIPDTTQTLHNMSQATSIEIQPDRDQVFANETIVLSVLVKDQFGIPVNNGAIVEINSTFGSLSSLSGETSGGLVNFDINSGGQWGKIIITATVKDTDISSSIEVSFIPFELYLPLTFK